MKQTVFILMLIMCFLGCDKKYAPISKSEAIKTLSKAESLEKEGELYKSLHTYKIVDVLYEANDEIRENGGNGGNGAQRTRAALKKQIAEVRAELELFRQQNGSYPDSLEVISKNLTDATKKSFNAIHYKKINAAEIKFTTYSI
jgi:hypothetical protein